MPSLTLIKYHIFGKTELERVIRFGMEKHEIYPSMSKLNSN